MSYSKPNRSDLRTVVVQETNGNWAGLLRRQLIGENVDVVRIETIGELSRRLEVTPDGCFALQIADGPKEIVTGGTHQATLRLPDFDVLDWIIDASARFPHATFCGLSGSPVVAWPVCEAGVSLVIDHPLGIVKLAQFVRRYFATRHTSQIDAESAVAGTENVVESLWLKLPWADHATPTNNE